MDYGGIIVRFQEEQNRFFSSSNREDELRGPPSFLLCYPKDPLPGYKAVEAWTWTLTSTYLPSQERVKLYLDSHMYEGK